MVHESNESVRHPIPIGKPETRFDRLKQHHVAYEQRGGWAGHFINVGFSICLLLQAGILICGYLILPLSGHEAYNAIGYALIIFILVAVMICVAAPLAVVAATHYRRLSTIHKCLGFAPILLCAGCVGVMILLSL